MRAELRAELEREVAKPRNEFLQARCGAKHAKDQGGAELAGLADRVMRWACRSPRGSCTCSSRVGNAAPHRYLRRIAGDARRARSNF